MEILAERHAAVLWCTTSMIPIPWVFEDGLDAEAFLTWLTDEDYRPGEFEKLTPAEQTKMLEHWNDNEREEA